jgi:hypothetical protein
MHMQAGLLNNSRVAISGDFERPHASASVVPRGNRRDLTADASLLAKASVYSSERLLFSIALRVSD